MKASQDEQRNRREGYSPGGGQLKEVLLEASFRHSNENLRTGKEKGGGNGESKKKKNKKKNCLYPSICFSNIDIHAGETPCWTRNVTKNAEKYQEKE